MYAIPTQDKTAGASLYSIYIPWRLTLEMYVDFEFGELSDDF